MIKAELIARIAEQNQHFSTRTSKGSSMPFWENNYGTYDLGILRGETFVLGIAGYHCNIAPDHRPSVGPDAEIHHRGADVAALFSRSSASG